MHAAVVIMMSVGNDHAGDVVVVLRFDPVIDVIKGNVKCTLAGRRLLGLGQYLWYIFNVAGQLVSIPERNEQPDKTSDDQDFVRKIYSGTSPPTGSMMCCIGVPPHIT